MPPTTSILVPGAGADADPLDGPWSHLALYGGSKIAGDEIRRVGGLLAAPATGSRRGMYRNDATYGPDLEVHGRLPTEPANNTEAWDLGLAWYNVTTTPVGYFLRYQKNAGAGGVDQLQLLRHDSGGNVVLATFVENNVPPGDRYVVRRTVVGGNNTFIVEKQYVNSAPPAGHAAGDWVQVIGPIVDNTYTGVARIALGIEGSAARVDMFGGGTLGVLVAPANLVLPVISGVAQTWQVLAVDNGAWVGAPWDGLAYTYQWKRDGVAITGATASTYQLQPADEGHTITCTVTATNAVGNAAATSAGVAAQPFQGGDFDGLVVVNGLWLPTLEKVVRGGVWT